MAITCQSLHNAAYQQHVLSAPVCFCCPVIKTTPILASHINTPQSSTAGHAHGQQQTLQACGMIRVAEQLLLLHGQRGIARSAKLLSCVLPQQLLTLARHRCTPPYNRTGRTACAHTQHGQQACPGMCRLQSGATFQSCSCSVQLLCWQTRRHIHHSRARSAILLSRALPQQLLTAASPYERTHRE